MTGHSDDGDIKALLESALADEPPLTLDRDEVFRQGRRKLRNRRVFATGGAIAGAVVAVVGAVVLTGLVAEEPESQTPPAASRTDRPAPPGPTLPLSTTEAPSLSGAHATTLTHVLADGGVLPDGSLMSRYDKKPVTFRVDGDRYLLEADVQRGAARGALTVSIAHAGASAATCLDLPDSYGACQVIGQQGVKVAVGTWKDPRTGEKRYAAYARHRDGSGVTAIATNLTAKQRKYGKSPADPLPVIDKASLAKLAAHPDLRIGS